MYKRVGIITFHRADNLGAVLQAYALQKTIEDKVGVCSEIIDYKCGVVEGTKHARKCVTLKDCVRYLPVKFYYFIKHRGFEIFRKKKLRLSDKTYNADNINECASKYDVFITGSDQVWNFECSGNDMAYFLDFVPVGKKKLSYAASIGQCEYSQERAKLAYNALKQFDSISVREESAAKQLHSIGVEEVTVLPDPVVLLSQEEWKRVMPGRLCKQKYVFVYLIAKDVNVCKSAELYAKKNNLKIINNKKSIEFILHNSPAEFLSWIFNAECVFTNSFHGTAYSLIFNKPLCADIELINGEINLRVKDLLQSVGAGKCILNSSNPYPQKPDVSDGLDVLKNKGIIYLNDNCR